MFSVVPLICEPLSCQPIAYTRAKYSHIADLDLADLSHVGDELQIDALVGSDCYWQIVTGKVIQRENSPIAIHTHLGWVLLVVSQHKATLLICILAIHYTLAHNQLTHSNV